jgi:hypothetical protein
MHCFIQYHWCVTSCKGSIHYPSLLLRNIGRLVESCARTCFCSVRSKITRPRTHIYASADKSGIVTTFHGLKIACLGGIYEPRVYSSSEVAPVRPPTRLPQALIFLTCSQGFSSPFFSSHTVDRLISNTFTKSTTKVQNYNSLAAISSTIESSQPVDILMSSVWPSTITQFSSVPLPSSGTEVTGAPPLDDLVRRIKPRYHFAAVSGQPSVFWEREPFVWDDEGGRISRFVSLGAFGGEPTSGKKQRVRLFFIQSRHRCAQESPSVVLCLLDSSSYSDGTASATPAERDSKPLHRARIATAQTAGVLGPRGEFHFWRCSSCQETPSCRFVVSSAGGRITERCCAAGTGDPTKPPPGYKCKRCESTEVCRNLATPHDAITANLFPAFY